jgi:hypothetical protein
MPWRDRQCHHRGAFLTVIGNALDGVEADVLYTTFGLRIFWLKAPGLQADCFRVYNDWLAEFVGYDRKHMAGLPMISLYDPKAGARELERCAKMGLKGAMIWCSPPEDQPYSSDIYDPFWAAAQELKMPVSLHAITGMGMEEPVQLGRALHARDRAVARGREIVQRADLLRRARPLPAIADRLGREQYRLAALLPAAHGPRL